MENLFSNFSEGILIIGGAVFLITLAIKLMMVKI
jgi:hypothetical protein